MDPTTECNGVVKKRIADFNQFYVPQNIYHFCENYKFLFNFKVIGTSTAQIVTNAKACAQQVKTQSSLIKLTMTMALLLATLNNQSKK